MSFNAREISDHDGQPVELYRFSHGVQVWRYTSGDKPFAAADGSYSPDAISGSAIRRGREWDSGSQKITLDYLNPVAQLWQGNRPREPVTVTIYSLHRGDADLVVKFAGEVQEARSTGQAVELSCVPGTYRFKRRIPMLRMSSRCCLQLYGSRCGVVREDHRLRVTVTGVVLAVLDAAGFASHPDGWWTNGYIRTLAGETRMVVEHTGTSVILEYPLTLDVGDQVDAFAGDDKSLATCRDKFNNLVNHLGFHVIPTRELFGPSVE